ncbi:elongation factor P [Sandaracinus amylolyticus]|uniref:elongation factor P n=1 Tax=Sandaracinus amylolyticus TaxID=927083 RepID=UPI001F010581|nr:elongation factor P [Sandaracinus amylolyticus]UJR80870.1 Elongation factor P [Sandaracinus amylolyticus]
MYDTSDIRKNLKVILDGAPCVVIDFQFVKPGKGQAFTRTKLRNMLTGNVLERTFKSGEKLAKADLEVRQMTFLYPEGDRYVFMDIESYEQSFLTAEQLGDSRFYLVDNMQVEILLWNEKPIGVTPPTHVDLKVVETEPGFKGDTSTNTLKAAKMHTGVTVMVPLFINEGDLLKIDTRTGEYVERAKK